MRLFRHRSERSLHAIVSGCVLTWEQQRRIRSVYREANAEALSRTDIAKQAQSSKGRVSPGHRTANAKADALP
eukprot:1596989-Rhodomonas_salina.3